MWRYDPISIPFQASASRVYLTAHLVLVFSSLLRGAHDPHPHTRATSRDQSREHTAVRESNVDLRLQEVFVRAYLGPVRRTHSTTGSKTRAQGKKTKVEIKDECEHTHTPGISGSCLLGVSLPRPRYS
jgi:hypothetical protein